MNTSSLTAGPPRQEQAIALRAHARQLHERIAVRAGLALIAWGRRQDEQRTHTATHLRRRNEQIAADTRADHFQRVALLGRSLI